MVVANPLIEALRLNNPKSTAFTTDASTISYPSGFPVLDYYLGYQVNVHGEAGDIIDTYANIGVSSGCYICMIGKSSTGKTTFAIQLAANIVRNFDNGFIIHYDLESASNLSRIQILTKFNIDEMKNKYILKKNKTYIQDIKKTIIDLYLEKTKNKEKYLYDTGKLDEYSNPIKLLEPTVIIIDSIPTMASYVNENDKKDLVKLEEVSSQTDRMRLTAEIGRFFNEILQYLNDANIIVIAINHIRANPQLGIVKSPAELLYLKQDEALPGGTQPQYLANYLLKFIAVGSEKYEEAEDGFDGFGVRMQIIKSRTNQAGQVVSMVYDKVRGMDSLRTSIEYAKFLGCLNGNKNGYYFNDDKENKFTKVNMHKDFAENPLLYKKLYDIIIPSLEKKLSSVSIEEMGLVPDELRY